MNKVRGEQRLTVGDVEYILVPTNQALASIEGRLDVGLVELAQRFLRAKPRMGDVAVILNECSRAGGKALPYEQAWDYALEKLAEANKLAEELLITRVGPAESDAGKAAAAAN